MIVGVSFRAKPGMADKLLQHLDDPEGARHLAAAMGATRNTLLWQGDRMIRILEFPEGTHPRPLAKIAEERPAVKEFLRKVGELAEPGFDIDEPSTLDVFNRDVALQLVYDVKS